MNLLVFVESVFAIAWKFAIVTLVLQARIIVSWRKCRLTIVYIISLNKVHLWVLLCSSSNRGRRNPLPHWSHLWGYLASESSKTVFNSCEYFYENKQKWMLSWSLRHERIVNRLSHLSHLKGLLTSSFSEINKSISVLHRYCNRNMFETSHI